MPARHPVLQSLLAPVACSHAPEPTGDPPGRVTLETIGPGHAATKVDTGIFRRHAIVTHGQHQFVTYYSPEATVVIAWRRLDRGAGRTIHDTGWNGNVRDAHNGISLGVSSNVNDNDDVLSSTATTGSVRDRW